MRGTARPPHEVRAVLALLGRESLSDYEISRRTGVPRSTVLNWRRGSCR
jgi:DNA-directed RNA polymerase specialized sigma24 family protein